MRLGGVLSLWMLASCTQGNIGSLSRPGQKLPVQSPVRTLVGSRVAETADATQVVELADLDGDGDRDLVVGNRGKDRLYLNDGKGQFVPGIVLQSGATGALKIADLDGDGKPEIVVGYGSSERARVFTNRGAGKFSNSGFAGPDQVRAIALVDVDGDGDQDVVFGRGGTEAHENLLYLNRAGVLTLAGDGHLPKDQDVTVALATADVDGDGDLDLFVANAAHGVGSRDRLYLNNGKGVFTEPDSLPRRPAGSTSIAFGDVDQDGDLDLVLGGPGANSVFIGDGTGRFVDESAARLGPEATSTTAVRLFDLDADKDLDLLVVNEREPSRVYINDGLGRFGSPTGGGLKTDLDRARSVTVGDVDGDGDQDIVIGNDGAGNSLYLNDGRVSFVDASRAPSLGASDPALEFVDVDGDKDLDIVAPNDGRVLINDGRGSFTPAPLPKTPNRVLQAVNVDVDQDGDADMVLLTSGRTRLYVNHGGGHFTDETRTLFPDDTGSDTRAIAAADVDGDGNVDLVFANDAQNRIFVGSKTGRYVDETATRLPAERHGSRAVSVVDLDGDGDGDLVVGEASIRNAVSLYRNDGKGVFAPAGSLPLSVVAGLIAGDVDGDGDPDLIVTLAKTASRTGSTLLFANDRGVFKRAPFPENTSEPAAPTLGDVDGDGDIDIVVAGKPTVVFLGDGRGVFVDATKAFFPKKQLVSTSVRLPDIDDDRDTDLVAIEDRGISLRYGLKFHVFAKRPPRIGEVYDLRIWANAGFAPNGQIVVPYLGLPGHNPLRETPFGTWHLGFAGFSSLDALQVPAPVGETALVIPIPLTQDLIGVRFAMQALVVSGSSFEDWRLTNVWTDQVLR